MGEIAKALKAIEKSGITAAVKHSEPLRNHTTFKIGGPVTVMYFPGDADCAIKIFEIACKHGVMPYIIGNGSNILASDAGIDAIVINTSRLKGCLLSEVQSDIIYIKADCGVLLSELAVFAQRNSATGLEFAHGIPGTLGGAVLMNAGAYGGEMKDVVYKTTAYSAERGIFEVAGNEHGFSYRESVFGNSNDIILASEIKLRRGDAAQISNTMKDLADKRRGSQPLELPSAGSTFKRPNRGYAAALIEQAGLKGYSTGGAQVSPKHSGFIVNNGAATFDDVMRLIEYVVQTVEKQTGISLEPEVRIWK